MQRYEIIFNLQKKLRFLTKKSWVRAELPSPTNNNFQKVTIKKIRLFQRGIVIPLKLLREVNLNHRSHRSDTSSTNLMPICPHRHF
jgi:hypothetical protein